jgi:phosphoglycerol transferase MdoB-like AlkP superfamily enzyme
MNYVDKELGKFIGSLDLSNTAVFIYGDHSSGSIKSELYRSSNLTLSGEYLEYVPLVIIIPDKKVFHVNKMVSFIDIAPTVLSLSGTDTIYRTRGENLLQTNVELKNKIQWFGKEYDREKLFKDINVYER